MFAVNNFNINKPLGTKVAEIGALNTSYWLGIGGKQQIKNNTYQNCNLSTGREYYDFYSFLSSSSNMDIIFTKNRTVSFKHGYEAERLCINNTSEKTVKVTLNSFYKFDCSDSGGLLMGAAGDKYTLKIVDAYNNRIFYFNASHGIYGNNVITKQGVLSRAFLCIEPHSSYYVYVTKTGSAYKPLKNIIEGEEVFNTARFDYKNLRLLSIKSCNANLDKLINELIPKRIINNYIYDAEGNKKDFFALINLLPFNNPGYNNSADFFKEGSLASMYFNLLYQYAGISFLTNGIILNLNKRDILRDLQITFYHSGVPINLIIKNNNVNINGFIYNGVEYSNIRFLPFGELVKNNKMVLEF